MRTRILSAKVTKFFHTDGEGLMFFFKQKASGIIKRQCRLRLETDKITLQLPRRLSCG